MSLGDVLYQSHAQRMVQRAISRDRVAHAYVFHGPDGVGKERFAIALAELLLCPDPVDRSIDGAAVDAVGAAQLRTGCGTCEDCQAVANGEHPDLHLVFRQLGRQHPDPTVRKRKALDIGVDVLRHFVMERVVRTPIRGRVKVFIIREADRLTVQAQNALLKTLEEPPGATVLMLLVTSLDKLLPTTLSRVQIVRFDALPTDFVRTRLTELQPDLSAEQVEWYACHGGGSIGSATHAVAMDLRGLAGRVATSMAKVTGGRSDLEAKSWIDESKSLGAVFRADDPDITDTEAGRRGLKQVMRLAADWYRDALRDVSGADPKRGSAGTGTTIPTTDLIDSISRIVRAERELDLNANTQLCLDTLVNDLTRIAQGGAVATR